MLAIQAAALGYPDSSPLYPGCSLFFSLRPAWFGSSDHLLVALRLRVSEVAVILEAALPSCWIGAVALYDLMLLPFRTRGR